MNCDTVQNRLMDGATSSFSDLEPHLSDCAGCSAFADRILAAEAEIGRELDAFMTARAPDYDRLPIPEPRRRYGMHALVLGLATAAVLALAALPALQGTPGHPRASGTVPDAVLAADEVLLEFDEIDMNDIDLDGLTRKEEDKAMRDLLTAKATTLKKGLDLYGEAMDSVGPEWQMEAALGMADLHVGMADGLENMIHPSYLTEEQSEVYQMALEDKAWVQKESALEAYEIAAKIAEESGFDDRADEILALSDELEAEQEARAIASEQEEAELVERGKAVEAEMLKRMAWTRETLDRCQDEIDAESIEEIEQVLEQAQKVIEAEEYAMYGDIAQMLKVYSGGLEEACP